MWCDMFKDWWWSPERFRLLPRRLRSIYWDDDNILIYTVWRQWGRWRFWMTRLEYPRKFYSNWDQVCDAAKRGDCDSEMIYGLVVELEQHTGEGHQEIYERVLNA